jgi:hypothetical protein
MITTENTASQISKLGLVMTVLLIAPWFISCGVHYSIDGQVVEAKTGKPVQGAVVAVNWQRTKLGVPGLPVPYENYGTFESVTDANGSFTVPKYLIGHHFMGVYKTGYICWSSETIFKPEGKDWKEMFARRHGNKVKNGMLVKLEAKSGLFPDVKHASFTLDVSRRVPGTSSLFFCAVKEEFKIYEKFIDERDRRGK